MVQNRKRMVKELDNAEIRLTMYAACSGAVHIEKKRPIIKNRGAPGG
jgi:hypothetical protein